MSQNESEEQRNRRLKDKQQWKLNESKAKVENKKKYVVTEKMSKVMIDKVGKQRNIRIKDKRSENCNETKTKVKKKWF